MNDKSNPFEGIEELEDKDEWSNVAAGDKPVVPVTLFVESCPKCRGTGSWRPGYPCFKCKGKGKLEFKTSAQDRQRGRKSAAKSKAKRSDENEAAYLEFLDANPDVRDWLVPAVAAGNSWAVSMYSGGLKYGSLTEGMIAAIRKAIARDDEGAAGFKAWVADHEGVLEWLEAETAAGNDFAASLLSKGKRFGTLTDGQLNAVLGNLEEGKATNDPDSELDLTELSKGYYAVPDGDTRLKVAIRRPGKNSRWNGWTFVDDGAEYGQRKTYGKQAPDGLYKGRIQAELKAIIADPLEAMVAYGKLTGTCGRCGRILEDEESVAAGIGPICAGKM